MDKCYGKRPKTSLLHTFLLFAHLYRRPNAPFLEVLLFGDIQNLAIYQCPQWKKYDCLSERLKSLVIPCLVEELDAPNQGGPNSRKVH